MQKSEKYLKLWEIISKASNEDKKKIIEKLSDEEIIELKAVANPYRKPIYQPKNNQKFAAFSYINMPEEYLKNFMMTTMIGFIYKMATEYKLPENNGRFLTDEEKGEFAELYNVYLQKFSKSKNIQFYKQAYEKSETNENYARYLKALEIYQNEKTEFEQFCKKNKIAPDSVYPENVNIDEADIFKIREVVKKKLGITQTKQDYEIEVQNHILDFLDYHFNFDPNNHIRCHYKPRYSSFPFSQSEKGGQNEKGGQSEKGEQSEKEINENFENYLVPPDDTFYHFKNYMETNYEYLRQCTDDIYGPSRVFANAVIIRETFSTENQFEQWAKKYEKDFDAGISCAPMNTWIFTDAFEGNRKNIISNEEKTEFIKEFLKKQREDEKLGSEILKKRVRKMPERAKENIPFVSEIESLGAEKIEPPETIEVKVWQSKVLRKKRLQAKLDNYSFDVESSVNEPKEF